MTPPAALLVIALVLTIIALAIDNSRLRRRRAAMRRLAAEWELHYSPTDRFGLATRLAVKFPVPGAADLRAIDLLYGSEGDSYRYLLTAEYTTGVVHSKKRRQRVCTFREPKSAPSRGMSVAAEDLSPLVLADPNRPALEQYRELYESQIAGRRAIRTEGDRGASAAAN
jgi:hypothetical protein